VLVVQLLFIAQNTSNQGEWKTGLTVYLQGRVEIQETDLKSVPKSPTIYFPDTKEAVTGRKKRATRGFMAVS